MVKRTILLFVISIVTPIITAPPPFKDRENGPCVGMSCLHGVLMHGDQEQGDAHQGQDAYQRLEAADRMRASTSNIGPCRGVDCLEQIQHGATDPEQAHRAEQSAPGPDRLQQQGPCRGMDCMHGVLMHGDTQQGTDHQKEDAQVRRANNEANRGQVPKVDPDAALHGSTVDHTKKRLTDTSTKPRDGKDKAPRMDPESILHGADIDHRDTRQKAPAPVRHLRREPDVGHLDALLHGGETVDHASPRAERQAERHSPDTVGDLESLLHGSHWEQGLHDRDTRTDRKPDSGAMRESNRAIVGVLDPHAMIHGQKTVIGKVPREEEADFQAWQREKVAGHGFTFAYITDSIVSELDMFRQRYIPRFWQEHHEDDAADGGARGGRESGASGDMAGTGDGGAQGGGESGASEDMAGTEMQPTRRKLQSKKQGKVEM